MILFYTPNTCSLATHLALEHAGAEYQLRRVNFGQNEQRSPELLRSNPKARVPALVTSQGILTATPAIERELLRSAWVMGDAYMSDQPLVQRVIAAENAP